MPKSNNLRQYAADLLRSIELTGFLASSCSKLTDQIFIGIPQYVNFGIIHAEVDFVQRSDDLCHNSTSILDSMTEL